jgi:hypothetical protein
MEQLEKRMDNMERVVERMLEKTLNLLEHQIPAWAPKGQREDLSAPIRDNGSNNISCGANTNINPSKMVEQSIKRSII